MVILVTFRADKLVLNISEPPKNRYARRQSGKKMIRQTLWFCVVLFTSSPTAFTRERLGVVQPAVLFWRNYYHEICTFVVFAVSLIASQNFLVSQTSNRRIFMVNELLKG